MVTATAFSFVLARLRLETGSVWPAVALHAAWNAVIQTAFDPASTGPLATLWVGESGILVALTMVVAAAGCSYGRWTIRRAPGERPETGAARPALGQLAAPSWRRSWLSRWQAVAVAATLPRRQARHRTALCCRALAASSSSR